MSNRLPIADFRVEPADYQTDFRDLRAVREPVFVVEQNVPIEEEWDALDPLCHHVIARDGKNRPIGTGRLTPEHKIGRMAVLREWRGKGVGEALLRTLIEQARALGWEKVSLHSQVSALGFYEKFGFQAYGERFWEAGIEHLSMSLALQPLADAGPPARPNLAARQIEFEGQQALIEISLQVIASARKSLWIYTRALEPGLYADARIIEALRAYAVQCQGGSAQILLQDPLALRAQPHALLPLVQRLSSVFQVSTPLESEDAQYPSAFIVSDRDAYVFRMLDGRFDGEWSPNLPARCRQLREVFAGFWARSRPCTELRALGI